MVAVLVTPVLLGRLNTYLLLALLLASVGYLVHSRRRIALEPADLIGLAAIALIALPMVLGADSPGDLFYVFNFAPMAMAIPARALFRADSERDWMAVVGPFAAAGAMIALAYAVIARFGFGYERVGQPFMNPFHFSATSVLLAFLSLTAYSREQGGMRFLMSVGFVAGLAALLLSGTRGGMLAIPPLLLFTLVALPARHRLDALRMAGVALLCLLAVIWLMFQDNAVQRTVTALGEAWDVVSGGSVDSSSEHRLVMYRAAIKAFWQRPLFGYGWGNMMQAVLPHVPAPYLGIISGMRHLHAGLVSFAVSGGLLGVAPYALFLSMPMMAVLSSPRNHAWSDRFYMAGVLTIGLFACDLTFLLFGLEYHTVQFAVLYAVIGGSQASPQSPLADGRG